MKRAHQSLHHALHGLQHALETERNLRLFLGTYVLILLLGDIESISINQWLLLILSGGLFTATELINTALERLVDTCDEIWRKVEPNVSGHHNGLKLTKDVASAASLVCLCVTIVVVVSIFLPVLLRKAIV